MAMQPINQLNDESPNKLFPQKSEQRGEEEEEEDEAEEHETCTNLKSPPMGGA